MPPRPWIDGFSSGYMQRAMHRFPKQGDREPWLNPQNYTRDKKMIRTAPLEDGALVFTNGTRAEAAEPESRLRLRPEPRAKAAET
jgi:hypothetical protein